VYYLLQDTLPLEYHRNEPVSNFDRCRYRSADNNRHNENTQSAERNVFLVIKNENDYGRPRGAMQR